LKLGRGNFRCIQYAVPRQIIVQDEKDAEKEYGDEKNAEICRADVGLHQ
jgi:hypothetical protein